MASGKEVSGKIPKGKASIRIHWFSLSGESNICKREEGAVRMNRSCTLVCWSWVSCVLWCLAA